MTKYQAEVNTIFRHLRDMAEAEQDPPDPKRLISEATEKLNTLDVCLSEEGLNPGPTRDAALEIAALLVKSADVLANPPRRK